MKEEMIKFLSILWAIVLIICVFRTASCMEVVDCRMAEEINPEQIDEDWPDAIIGVRPL